TSMATIAMCASLVAGGTYALFTSESAVNVAVTSGTVSVVATLDGEIELGSTLGENVTETAVEYSADSNTIALTNMVPGDYIEFDINVHNASDVTVKYQTAISVVEDDGLFDGLVVSIDEETLAGKDAKMSKWATLNVGSDDIIVPVRVELPEDEGNEYQGKTCTIAYTVNAVQGNAATYDPAPQAQLTEFTDAEKIVDFANVGGYDHLAGTTAELAVGMSFAATETAEEIANSQYASWAADYVISFDKDITYVYDANDNLKRADLVLIGEFKAYSDVVNGGEKLWIPLPLMFPDETSATEFGWTRTVDETTGDVTCVLPANKGIRLIRLLGASGMVTSPDPDAAYALTYDWMPTVEEFSCGIVTDLSALGLDYTTPASTGVHLELNLYEFTENEDGAYTETMEVNCVTYDTVLVRNVLVTPDNIATTTFDANATYTFKGDFTGDSYTIKTSADREMVLDASAATFANASNVRFTFGAIADGLATLVSNGDWKEKTGSYTVKGFNVENGSLSCGGANTTMNIVGNSAKAMDVDGSNCTVNVENNTIVCDGTYVRYDGEIKNDKAFYMLAVNYALALTGNDFTATTKDTVSINGRGEYDMADFSNQADGSIAESKIVNSIKLKDNTLNAARRGLYIWGDHTFGSNYTLPSGSATKENLNAAAKELVQALLNDQVSVQVGESLIGFGGVYLTVADSESLS
ncbi:MAG: hypothetical protein IJ317_01390, partial [Clostridia bacterium]|nr:hypothetical protein [Clostridia bacterium]